MNLTALDYLAAGGAAAAAGAINALAGGGTLVSFPTLVGLGVPAVNANVTNTVALLPGYLSGSWAQRDDLRPQLRPARKLSVVAGIGGLAGSVLLVFTPERDFRAAVPYLIVASCVLLLVQDRVRDRVRAHAEANAFARARTVAVGGPVPAAPGEDPLPMSPALVGATFVASVYGGFFGAGLGIMLLAILGLFTDAAINRVNAVKSLLSFFINLVAAVFFAFSGHVQWLLVPVMAAASLVGGHGGGRLVRVVNGALLRNFVVAVGAVVAVSFWVT